MAKSSDNLDDRSPRSTGRRRPRIFRRVLTGIIVIAVLAGGYWGWQRYFAAAPQRAAGPPPGVPVTVASVATQDVPIYLEALGTVSGLQYRRDPQPGRRQAAVGEFHRGPGGQKGEVLAVIDPRPFQAALDQAIAKKAQDQAQLVAAQKDLARFTDARARKASRPSRTSISSRPRSISSRRRSTPTRPRSRARRRSSPMPHHRADRWPRRLPPGRCRQHHSRQRSESADGAHADPPVDGDLHAAAKGAGRRARGDAARPGHGARLRPGQRAKQLAKAS